MERSFRLNHGKLKQRGNNVFDVVELCAAGDQGNGQGRPRARQHTHRIVGIIILQMPISFQGLPCAKLIPAESLYFGVLPVGACASMKKSVPFECMKYGTGPMVIPELRLAES